MTVRKIRLTLFDLDHTLLPIDSDYAWGAFTQEIGWCDGVAFKRRNEEFYEQYKAGTLDIRDYVRFATEAIRLRGPVQAEAAHRRFMRTVVEPAIRPEALDLLGKHKAAGEQLVIVTATNEFVTRPIARVLGVDELIAVELERGADGWITGEVAGVPSAREGKVERVRQWLAARALRWEDVEATFYSDSINDLALLEAVDHPVATNPDDGLRAIAQQRGWRILELFKRA